MPPSYKPPPKSRPRKSSSKEEEEGEDPDDLRDFITSLETSAKKILTKSNQKRRDDLRRDNATVNINYKRGGSSSSSSKMLSSSTSGGGGGGGFGSSGSSGNGGNGMTKTIVLDIPFGMKGSMGSTVAYGGMNGNGNDNGEGGIQSPYKPSSSSPSSGTSKGMSTAVFDHTRLSITINNSNSNNDTYNNSNSNSTPNINKHTTTSKAIQPPTPPPNSNAKSKMSKSSQSQLQLPQPTPVGTPTTPTPRTKRISIDSELRKSPFFSKSTTNKSNNRKNKNGGKKLTYGDTNVNSDEYDYDYDFDDNQTQTQAQARSPKVKVKVQSQGPTSWSSSDLRLKYRSYFNRSHVYNVYSALVNSQSSDFDSDSKAFDSKAFDKLNTNTFDDDDKAKAKATTFINSNSTELSASLSIPRITPHPLQTIHSTLLRNENKSASERSKIRGQMKRFSLSVHTVWITNLSGVREHRGGLDMDSVIESESGDGNDENDENDDKYNDYELLTRTNEDEDEDNNRHTCSTSKTTPKSHSAARDPSRRRKRRGLNDNRDTKALKNVKSQIQSVNFERSLRGSLSCNGDVNNDDDDLGGGLGGDGDGDDVKKNVKEIRYVDGDGDIAYECPKLEEPIERMDEIWKVVVGEDVFVDFSSSSSPPTSGTHREDDIDGEKDEGKKSSSSSSSSSSSEKSKSKSNKSNTKLPPTTPTPIMTTEVKQMKLDITRLRHHQPSAMSLPSSLPLWNVSLYDSTNGDVYDCTVFEDFLTDLLLLETTSTADNDIHCRDNQVEGESDGDGGEGEGEVVHKQSVRLNYGDVRINCYASISVLQVPPSQSPSQSQSMSANTTSTKTSTNTNTHVKIQITFHTTTNTNTSKDGSEVSSKSKSEIPKILKFKCNASDVITRLNLNSASASASTGSRVSRSRSRRGGCVSVSAFDFDFWKCSSVSSGGEGKGNGCIWSDFLGLLSLSNQQHAENDDGIENDNDNSEHVHPTQSQTQSQTQTQMRTKRKQSLITSKSTSMSTKAFTVNEYVNEYTINYINRKLTPVELDGMEDDKTVHVQINNANATVNLEEDEEDVHTLLGVSDFYECVNIGYKIITNGLVSVVDGILKIKTGSTSTKSPPSSSQFNKSESEYERSWLTTKYKQQQTLSMRTSGSLLSHQTVPGVVNIGRTGLWWGCFRREGFTPFSAHSQFDTTSTATSTDDDSNGSGDGGKTRPLAIYIRDINQSPSNSVIVTVVLALENMLVSPVMIAWENESRNVNQRQSQCQRLCHDDANTDANTDGERHEDLNRTFDIPFLMNTNFSFVNSVDGGMHLDSMIDTRISCVVYVLNECAHVLDYSPLSHELLVSQDGYMYDDQRDVGTSQTKTKSKLKAKVKSVSSSSSLPLSSLSPSKSNPKPNHHQIRLKPPLNNFNFPQTSPTSILTPNPHLPSYVYGVTTTGASSNTTGVLPRTISSSSLIQRGVLCRVRTAGDYRAMLSNVFGEGAHGGSLADTMIFTTYMRGYDVRWIGSGGRGEFEKGYGEVLRGKEEGLKVEALREKIRRGEGRSLNGLRVSSGRSKAKTRRTRRDRKGGGKGKHSYKQSTWIKRVKQSVLLATQNVEGLIHEQRMMIDSDGDGGGEPLFYVCKDDGESVGGSWDAPVGWDFEYDGHSYADDVIPVNNGNDEDEGALNDATNTNTNTTNDKDEETELTKLVTTLSTNEKFIRMIAEKLGIDHHGVTTINENENDGEVVPVNDRDSYNDSDYDSDDSGGELASDDDHDVDIEFGYTNDPNQDNTDYEFEGELGELPQSHEDVRRAIVKAKNEREAVDGRFKSRTGRGGDGRVPRLDLTTKNNNTNTNKNNTTTSIVNHNNDTTITTTNNKSKSKSNLESHSGVRGFGWRSLPISLKIPKKTFTSMCKPQILKCDLSTERESLYNLPCICKLVGLVDPVDVIDYSSSSSSANDNNGDNNSGNIGNTYESMFISNVLDSIDRTLQLTQIRQANEIALMEEDVTSVDKYMKNTQPSEFTSIDNIMTNVNSGAKDVKSSDEVLSDYINLGIQAVKNANYADIEEALDNGVNVNSTDEHGNTFLIQAAQQINKRMIKFLLRRGAYINGQNFHGNCALHFLREYSKSSPGGGGGSVGMELFDYLKSKGADDRILNQEGCTCYEGLRRDDLERL